MGPPAACRGLALAAPTSGLPPGTAVLWTVAPEAIALDPVGPHAATVTDAVDLGLQRELVLTAAELELTVRTRASGLPPLGSAQRISLPPEAISVWAARR